MAMVRDPEDDRTSRRWRWILLTIVGVLPFGAIGLFIGSFDAEIFKPQIIAAVKQATGRDLAIHGRLHLAFSLSPTIAAENVSFANAPGGSRAEMVKLARIEAKIALLPLLQHQLSIDTLALVRPDIVLETDAQGHGNWRFAEATPAPAGTGRVAPPAQARGSFFVRSVRIDDGTLTWHDGRTGGTSTLRLRQAEFQMESATAPISVSMDALWNGTGLGVSGQVGSISGLQGQSAAPWPLRLILTTGGTAGDAKLNVSGVITTPLQGKGYQLKLDGQARNLAALAALLPGVRLPALRDVTVAAEVTDRGTALPDIAGLAVRAGPSDLAALVPGLKLARLEVSVPRMDQPARITAEGTLDGSAMALLASIGAPAQIVATGTPAAPTPAAPVPVDMALSVAGARITMKGNVANPAQLAGVDVLLRATVPDLGVLGQLGHLGLPGLKDATLQARIMSGANGLARGVVLKDMQLTQASIDLAGDLTLGLGARPSAQGNITAKRIDLDALLGTTGQGTTNPGTTSPGTTNPAGPSPPPARGQQAARGGQHVIPDDPLPFAALRVGDGDIQMRVDELVRQGETTRNLAFRLTVKDGRLKLDPFTADLPAGRVAGSLNVDASREEPAVALLLRAPGLDIHKLYQALGRDGEATGTVEVDVDLRGRGQSPHAIAATADGHLGMAVVGASVENRVLNLGLFGDLLRGIKQDEALARRGTTQVRCFALRVDATAGNGDVRALLLDSSTLFLEGAGGMNLGEETLALRMRAQARMLGMNMALPLRVSGNFAAPRPVLDPTSTPAAIGQALHGTAETAAGMGAVGGALGAGAVNPPAGPDACAGQLAIARGGRAGATPAALPGTPEGQAGQGRRARPNLLQRLLPR